MLHRFENDTFHVSGSEVETQLSVNHTLFFIFAQNKCLTGNDSCEKAEYEYLRFWEETDQYLLHEFIHKNETCESFTMLKGHLECPGKSVFHRSVSEQYAHNECVSKSQS